MIPFCVSKKPIWKRGVRSHCSPLFHGGDSSTISIAVWTVGNLSKVAVSSKFSCKGTVVWPLIQVTFDALKRVINCLQERIVKVIGDFACISVRQFWNFAYSVTKGGMRM